MSQEAHGPAQTAKMPGGHLPSGSQGHIDAWVLLLLEPDRLEAYSVTVVKFAAGIVVQLHHIRQRHSVALIAGRRSVPADGIDLLQIAGTEVAVEHERVIFGIRLSELPYLILVPKEAHCHVHILFKLPDAAALSRLHRFFAVHGLRVIETDKGRFISMPQESYKKNGETVYNDTFHAVTAEARTALVDAVNDAYEQRLQERMEQSEDVPAQGMEQQM